MSYTYDQDVTILPWPASVECRGRTLHRTGKTSVHVSPLTRATQTQELVGGQWTLSATFPPLDDEQQRVLRVFIAKLKGQQGFFYFPAESTVADIPDQPEVPGPDLDFAGPHLVEQAFPGQLETGGWDEPEGTLLFSAGEHVSYDDALGWRRLHLVVKDCYARSGGRATLAVEPPVRSAVVPGSILHDTCPCGVFKLSSDEDGSITRTAESGEVSLSAVEAFPPRILIS